MKEGEYESLLGLLFAAMQGLDALDAKTANGLRLQYRAELSRHAVTLGGERPTVRALRTFWLDVTITWSRARGLMPAA